MENIELKLNLYRYHSLFIGEENSEFASPILEKPVTFTASFTFNDM